MTTNYERIKKLTVDEMAKFLCDNTCCYSCDNYQLNIHWNEDCMRCNKRKSDYKQWLQSENEV